MDYYKDKITEAQNSIVKAFLARDYGTVHPTMLYQQAINAPDATAPARCAREQAAALGSRRPHVPGGSEAAGGTESTLFGCGPLVST